MRDRLCDVSIYAYRVWLVPSCSRILQVLSHTATKYPFKGAKITRILLSIWG